MSENVDSVPEEFIKVIRDFIGDLKTTFPEYVPFIDKLWKSKDHFNYIDEEEDRIKAYEKSEKKSIFDFKLFETITNSLLDLQYFLNIFLNHLLIEMYLFFH